MCKDRKRKAAERMGLNPDLELTGFFPRELSALSSVTPPSWDVVVTALE